MKGIVLASFFIILLQSLSVRSDPANTRVQSPLYSETILQKNYTIANPNPSSFDYGANWIWSNGTTRSATFETLFYARLSGTAYLYVMANSSYYAYINGFCVRSGSKYQTDQTQIYLSCGLNNLTIKAQNNDTNAVSGGLIFQISQGQSNPPMSCSNNGFYNYSSCACQCSGVFTCPAPQIMVGYPACGCKCMNEGILNCNYHGQYFDRTTCSCKCLPSYCREGFEQDPYTCNCRCIASTCSTGRWNYNQCRCL